VRSATLSRRTPRSRCNCRRHRPPEWFQTWGPGTRPCCRSAGNPRDAQTPALSCQDDRRDVDRCAGLGNCGGRRAADTLPQLRKDHRGRAGIVPSDGGDGRWAGGGRPPISATNKKYDGEQKRANAIHVRGGSFDFRVDPRRLSNHYASMTPARRCSTKRKMDGC
jgi:hypothetical protein